MQQNNRKYKIVFLFSGQGSQYRGMGEELYKNNRTFSKSLKESDHIVKKLLGRSLIEEIYGNQTEAFEDLLITHPAIVAVELAMVDVMSDLGIIPDYVSGSSLGEFSAAVCSNVWAKEEALTAAIEQAKSIVQHCPEGGMLVVYNDAQVEYLDLLAEYQLHLVSENFSNHYTLAGEQKNLQSFHDRFKKMGVSLMRLPVKYPFHCDLIDQSKARFDYFSQISDPLSKPTFRFISGLYTKELNSIPKDYFWEVISKPLNFTKFVSYMEALHPCLYIDLGPSGTSATFVKYNLDMNSKSLISKILTPFKRDIVQLDALKSNMDKIKTFRE
jgi:bacillaene synthase trans-acting acyltransferase